MSCFYHFDSGVSDGVSLSCVLELLHEKQVRITMMSIETFTYLGRAVCTAQKLEFTLYGIAAHSSDLSEGRKDRRFTNLTPEDFLSTAPAKRDLRKATLGQIANLFANDLLLPSADLEKLVNRRNLVFHEFWRETRTILSTGSIANPDKFLAEFIRDCDEWIAALEGLISYIREVTATKEDRLEDVHITQAEQIKREKFQTLYERWQKEQAAKTI